jgi:hypothetical protein
MNVFFSFWWSLFAHSIGLLLKVYRKCTIFTQIIKVMLQFTYPPRGSDAQQARPKGGRSGSGWREGWARWAGAE